MRYVVVLMLVLLTLTSYPVQLQTSEKSVSTFVPVTLAQFDDEVIVINNNTGFEILGFPGNGTQSSPYLIENQRIQSVDGSSGLFGIYISDTDAYFIIRNCTVVAFYGSGYAIRLYNVSNALIEHCNVTISTTFYSDFPSAYGIYASKIENVHAWNCFVSGGSIGIQFHNGIDCSIKYNSVIDQMNSGVRVTWINDTDVQGNSIIGREDGRTLYGIYVMANVWNCSVYSNIISHFRGVGIRLQMTTDMLVMGNNVTGSSEAILVQISNYSLIQSNILTNSFVGLYVDYYSYNNTLTYNILGNNTLNAKDRGDDNNWISNWYSDYGGSGAYVISGPANSVDLTPQPTALHIPLLMMRLMILSVIMLIPIGAAIGYYVNYKKQGEKSLSRGPSLLIMALSILLPCGLSATPLPDPALPNLRFIMVDVLFSLGASRTPGTNWTVNYYSSSVITRNDMLLLVALPYLIGSLLSIVYLMAYLRRELSLRLLCIGTLIIMVIIMIVPLSASVLLIPVTPLLALSISIWVDKMKIEPVKKEATSD